MKTAISTITLSGSLSQKIEAAAQAGFEAIEVFDSDLIQFSGTPSDVKAIAEDQAVEILSLQPFRDLEGMPENLRDQRFSHFQKRLEMTQELGAQRMILCSNASPLALDDPEQILEDLHRAAEMAKKMGIKLAYEAVSWGRFVADYDKAWELVSKVDHPNLGINLDTFHLFSRGNSLDCLRDEIPVKKIFTVQIADAPTVQMYDLMHYSRHSRCFPGQGGLPIVEFMRVLLDKGFDDYVSLEIFNDEFRASSAEQRAVDGMRSAIWLDDQCHQVEDSAEITDIEFIEFAIEGKEGESIVEMLNALGFRETHKHISKAVSLMQMGDINLVLNREPTSQAHRYYKAHGASVCALALTTSNLSESIKRAQHYKIRKFKNTTAPGELNIPAFKGVGDALVYLVERSGKYRFFDVDFEAIEGVDKPEVGLQQIDHIAQSVKNTDFLSASFFYKSVFKFKTDAIQDLPDVYGLVTSRVASSENDRVKIAINKTEARLAAPQRFIQRTHGAGVQQIAFSTDDIFKAAAMMDPKKILPVPENYYRELEGLFGLEAELVEKLKSLNLLYDENENGTFFHFYTREVQGAFFEVVQRVGEYKNFGEANAPIRFAAQESIREYEALLSL